MAHQIVFGVPMLGYAFACHPTTKRKPTLKLQTIPKRCSYSLIWKLLTLIFFLFHTARPLYVM